MHAGFLISAGALWLGFAVLLFLALYPIVIYRMALGHNHDGMRPSHWLMIAAPVVVALTWHRSVSRDGQVFVPLYLGALAVLPAMVYGIWPARCAATPACIVPCLRWSMASGLPGVLLRPHA
jgi:hypothetical protein